MAGDLAFDWDRANIAHIARHRISPNEVEQLFANVPLDLSADDVGGETRYTSLGHTNEVRVLIVVWTMRGEWTRPITAFKAPRKLAQRYLAERRLEVL